MLCISCDKREPQQDAQLCDVCATFEDPTYDFRYEAVLHQQATFDDDVEAVAKLKWSEAARESRERIAAKYPSRRRGVDKKAVVC